jgi:hypothetical protein
MGMMTSSNTIEPDITLVRRADFLNVFAQPSPLMRRARKVEMPFQSDEELARPGQKRDEIFDRAFQIYRGL